MTDSQTGSSTARVLSIGPYELWFVAQLTMGLVYVGGAMFVLPPFTLSLPGATPGDVGVTPRTPDSYSS